MRELVELALDTATARGATYADARVIEHREQTVSVKDGRVDALSEMEDRGVGVRAIADGAWGFAASASLASEDVERTAALAVEIARASSLASRGQVDIGPAVTSRGTYRTPVQIDPFGVPVEEKIELLLAADREMRRVDGVTVTRGSTRLPTRREGLWQHRGRTGRAGDRRDRRRYRRAGRR